MYICMNDNGIENVHVMQKYEFFRPSVPLFTCGAAQLMYGHSLKINT